MKLTFLRYAAVFALAILPLSAYADHNADHSLEEDREAAKKARGQFLTVINKCMKTTIIEPHQRGEIGDRLPESEQGELKVDDNNRITLEGEPSPFFKCLADEGLLRLDSDDASGDDDRDKTQDPDGAFTIDELLRGPDLSKPFKETEEEEGAGHGDELDESEKQQPDDEKAPADRRPARPIFMP